LAEGDPASFRTAEISNWTGKAVAGPRSQLELILHCEDAKIPEIYFLTGINSETGRPRVYVGEAEVVRTRLKSHLDRDFWKTVIFFVSPDTVKRGRNRTMIITKQDVLNVLDQNKSQLRALGVRRIGLFGCFVRGEQRPDSDIDLLVEFQPGRVQIFWNNDQKRTRRVQSH